MCQRCAPLPAGVRDDFHRFLPFSGEVTHAAVIGKLVF
jgi:hypothetical protein